MKHCEKCNSLMPVDAPRCIRCGHESQQRAAPAPTAMKKPATPAARAAQPAAGGGKRPGRIRMGWMLAKQSWRVLMLDKELLVFPLLSGIASLLVIASFIAGIWGSGMLQANEEVGEPVIWVTLLVFYFVNYFVIVFFNSALIACAMIRFQGGDPTVRDGLRAAMSRLPQIAAWALLAASVGVVLRMIEERVQFVGKIVIALIGAAWTIAAYFAVPVLVVEKTGPVDAFKRSAEIIRKAWGESLVSNVGIGVITIVTGLLIVVGTVAITGVLAAQTGSVAVVLTGLAVLVVLLVLLTLVSSALNSIVLTALYLYAAENKLPEAFEGTDLPHAFAAKT